MSLKLHHNSNSQRTSFKELTFEATAAAGKVDPAQRTHRQGGHLSLDQYVYFALEANHLFLGSHSSPVLGLV
jgi:hypothetical protein